MRILRYSVKLCRGCGKERAKYLYNGRIRWDRYHDLCPRCYRSELDRQRARLLAKAGAEAA